MMIQKTRPSFFCQYRVLLGKDLRREFRTKEMLSSMGIYAILVLVVYGAAFAHTAASFDILQMSGGLLWALVVFTSLLGLSRSFSHEKENGCMEALLLAPLDRSVIFLAKATSNLLFMLVVEIIVLPLFIFFFLSSATLHESFWLVIPVLIVGTLGIAGIGTLLSTITMSTKGKDVMLAVMIIPVAFPLLYSCASATAAVIVASEGFMDVFIPAMILALVYDLIMLPLCWALYDIVISS